MSPLAIVRRWARDPAYYQAVAYTFCGVLGVAYLGMLIAWTASR